MVGETSLRLLFFFIGKGVVTLLKDNFKINIIFTVALLEGIGITHITAYLRSNEQKKNE
jgi:hypothetical protein